jgi:hypothetical protein
VTIATPFLDFHYLTPEADGEFDWLFFGIWLASYALGLLIYRFSILEVWEAPIHPWVPAVFFLVWTCAVFALDKYVWEPFRQAGASTAIDIERQSTRRVKPASLLALRAIDDEAALVLALAALIARLSRVGVYLVSRYLRYLSFLAAFFVALPAAVMIAFEWGQPDLSPSLATWRVFMIVEGFGIVYVLCGLLVYLGKCCFGWEFLRAGPYTEINVQSAPDTQTWNRREAAQTLSREPRLYVFTLYRDEAAEKLRTAQDRKQPSVEKRGLRHGLYNHPDCVPYVVQWIKDVVLCDNHVVKRT